MNWQAIALSFLAHTKLILAGIGFGGTGIGIVKFLNHSPAPFQDQVWYGAAWDTLQDMVSNTARIGARRTREGVSVPAVAAAPEVPPPVPAPAQPVPAPVEPLAKSGIERDN